MKMGSVDMAAATAVMVMIGSLLHRAEGQVMIFLSHGARARFDDSTTVVQQLCMMPGLCCQKSSGFCTVILQPKSTTTTIYGPTGFCPNCANVGNDLNKVLGQCNQLGLMVGVFSPNDFSNQLFYLTSAFDPP